MVGSDVVDVVVVVGSGVVLIVVLFGRGVNVGSGGGGNIRSISNSLVPSFSNVEELSKLDNKWYLGSRSSD